MPTLKTFKTKLEKIAEHKPLNQAAAEKLYQDILAVLDENGKADILALKDAINQNVGFGKCGYNEVCWTLFFVADGLVPVWFPDSDGTLPDLSK